MSKKNYDTISKFINECRTHYLKWDLTHDISIRYHFLHQSNRELEGQFIIKLHKEGAFNLVERDFAKKMILSYKQSTEAPNTEEELSKPDWEITGRRVKCPLTGKTEYLKTIINLRTNETHFGIDINLGFKEMSYGPDGELMFKEKDVAGIPYEYQWRDHYNKLMSPRVEEESINIQPIRVPDANELPPQKWLDDYAQSFDNNISSSIKDLAKEVYLHPNGGGLYKMMDIAAGAKIEGDNND